MADLDEIDARLLRLLQKDSRRPLADLADEAGLSTSACHRRVQRLTRMGVIRGQVALVDARAVGRSVTAFVEISLSSQADDVLEAFERAVRAIPDVLECHLTTGAHDYLLKLVARDPDDFARIHRRHLARLPGVAKIESSFALKTIRNTTALPV